MVGSKVLHILHAVLLVCHGEKRMFGVDLVSKQPLSDCVQQLTGGQVSNIVPDQASITFLDAGTPQTLAFHGVAGHTAFPENSVNAVALLCAAMAEHPALTAGDRRLFAALHHSHQDYYGVGLGIHCEDEVSGRLTAVGSILSLEKHRIKQHYNIRYPVTADARRIEQQLAYWADANGFVPDTVRHSAPAYLPVDHPAVTLLTDSYRQCTGHNAPPYAMAGGTYARKLPRALGYGMGLPLGDAPRIFPDGHGGCHGPDEAQYLDNLFRAVEILAAGLYCLGQHPDALG